MSEEMVERVARVLAPEHEEPLEPGLARAIAMDEARAVIEAMREPTEAMKNAGFAMLLGNVPVAMIWRAMIDAALVKTSG